MRKILLFQPLVYRGEERFHATNLGALAAAFNRQGVEAVQVLYAPQPSENPGQRDGILLCSPAEAESGEWWISQRPWAVVTNTWGASRFSLIHEAVRAATPRHIERLDTDSMRSARVEPVLYYHHYSSRLRDARSALKKYFAPVISLAAGTAHRLLPSILENRQALAISRIPMATAESPLAVARMKRLQQSFGHHCANISLSPFPVAERDLAGAPGFAYKENLVISVARWEAHQKNFPLTLRSLDAFLSAKKGWKAVLPGSLPKTATQLIRRLAPNSHARIETPGPLSHRDILKASARSKIFLMASRHESFGIAAAEALCSGCSVVGPAHIPSVPWFCGSDSGTVATFYSAKGLCDALAVESDFWKSGRREPERIACTWRGMVGAAAVARDLICKLDGLHATG